MKWMFLNMKILPGGNRLFFVKPEKVVIGRSQVCQIIDFSSAADNPIFDGFTILLEIESQRDAEKIYKKISVHGIYTLPPQKKNLQTLYIVWVILWYQNSKAFGNKYIYLRKSYWFYQKQ